MTILGRWYISVRAVREYATLARLPCATEDELHERTMELARLAEGAHYVQTQRNGLEQWRLGRPRRWRLLVSTAERPEGELPQLVRVMAGSEPP